MYFAHHSSYKILNLILSKWFSPVASEHRMSVRYSTQARLGVLVPCSTP